MFRGRLIGRSCSPQLVAWVAQDSLVTILGPYVSIILLLLFAIAYGGIGPRYYWPCFRSGCPYVKVTMPWTIPQFTPLEGAARGR